MFYSLTSTTDDVSAGAKTVMNRQCSGLREFSVEGPFTVQAEADIHQGHPVQPGNLAQWHPGGVSGAAVYFVG